MTKQLGAWAIIPIWILFLAFTPIEAGQSNEESAAAAAESWLVLVEGEKYEESWMAASSFFKHAVTKEQWISSMNAYRKPLGKIIRRDVKRLNYTTSLPGAPDGEYVVIQYESSFANKKSAIETITPMKDIDGQWRVSGYYIK